MSDYDALAPAYDTMTAGHAHDAWLKAIERLALEHGLSGRRVLDVACGTGKSFAPLLRRGYAVTACDASPAMAARARERAARTLRGRAGATSRAAAGPAARPGARVLIADMRALPRLGEFDLITCLDDAVNHLLAPGDVLSALRGMRANLAARGLVAFDVNLLAAYAGAADVVTDGGRHYVCWRGAAARGTPSGGTAEIVVDLFSARPGGCWRRRTLRQSHRHYPLAELRALASEAGLRVLAVRGQRPGGVLAPDVDESSDRKALLLLARS